MTALLCTSSYLLLEFMGKRFNKKFGKDINVICVLSRIVMQIAFFFIAFKLLSMDSILYCILGNLILISKIIDPTWIIIFLSIKVIYLRTKYKLEEDEK